MLNFFQSFYAFLEDPINYILCNFQLVIRMFSTILMPTKIGPGFGSGSQALVPASIPSNNPCKVNPTHSESLILYKFWIKYASLQHVRLIFI